MAGLCLPKARPSGRLEELGLLGLASGSALSFWGEASPEAGSLPVSIYLDTIRAEITL